LLKNKIKNIVFSSKFLIRFYYLFHNISYKIKQYKIDLSYVKNESNYIFRELNDSRKTVFTIVHDLKVSPPTIGDFLWNLMIARFFIILNKQTNFIIILNEEETQTDYLNEIDKIVSTFLNFSNLNFKKIFWKEFLNKKNIYGTIVHENKILNRKSTYIHGCNFLNILLNNYPNFNFDKFLLNKKETIKFNNKINHKYITWHCRFNENWSKHRNIKKLEFFNLLQLLNKSFPNYKILIVSDYNATIKFKSWIKDHHFDIMFSQDICNGFVESADLILNSSFYYQYSGGGIGMIPILSSLPYFIFGISENEKWLNNKKLCTWSKPNQNFVFEFPRLNKNLKEFENYILNHFNEI
jgi:hypothetical protein